jgi:hypothetical protein
VRLGGDPGFSGPLSKLFGKRAITAIAEILQAEIVVDLE